MSRRLACDRPEHIAVLHIDDGFGNSSVNELVNSLRIQLRRCSYCGFGDSVADFLGTLLSCGLKVFIAYTFAVPSTSALVDRRALASLLIVVKKLIYSCNANV